MMKVTSNEDEKDLLLIPSDSKISQENFNDNSGNTSLNEALKYLRMHAPIKVKYKNKLVSPFIHNETREVFLRYMALSITKSNGFRE